MRALAAGNKSRYPVAEDVLLGYILIQMRSSSLRRLSSSSVRANSVRLVLCALLFVTLIWVQGSMLWHDTAHVTHNHGDSILCELSAVAHEPYCFDQNPVPQRTTCYEHLLVANTLALPFSSVPLAYHSRAPPALVS